METKKWYKSKGVDGSLVGIVTMLVMLVMKFTGIDAEAEQANVHEIVMAVIALIGMVVALVGRLRAKTRIE